jgi:hypothetical protein
MPKFIDYHANMPPVSPEMAKQMTENLKKGKPDQFGVTGINVYVGQGEAFCMTDAPNADSVVKSHQALGFKLTTKDVHQVQPILQ